MQIQYKQVVIWDSTLIDVGFIGSEQSVYPTALRGLACNAVKITTGAPTATAGQWIPGALVTNAIDGTLWQNTGSTASPVWSLVDNTNINVESTIAYNADATAGPATLTAAQMINAIWDRNGGATNRTDTTPTAAQLLAAVPGAIIGSSFVFYYRNASATPGQLDTLAAGSGVTLSGNVLIAAGQTQTYIARFTNVTVAAVTLYAVNEVAGALAEVITASTVNTLQITTAATGNAVAFAAVGSDTNIGLNINGKGSGQLSLGGTSTGLVRIGQGSAKQLIQGGAVTALGATQNSTPTAAQLLGGIVTQQSQTGAGTVTTPTGTELDAAITNIATGDSFRVRFANIGNQTLTITAGASGVTIVGTATVATNTNIDLLFVRTGANTWVVYTNK